MHVRIAGEGDQSHIQKEIRGRDAPYFKIKSGLVRNLAKKFFLDASSVAEFEFGACSQTANESWARSRSRESGVVSQIGPETE